MLESGSCSGSFLSRVMYGEVELGFRPMNLGLGSTSELGFMADKLDVNAFVVGF